MKDWINISITALVALAAMAGGWKLMGENVARLESKMTALDERIKANEEYDGYLQQDLDKLKDRSIRTEVKVENLNDGVKDLSISINNLAKELKENNENFNKFVIEQARGKR